MTVSHLGSHCLHYSPWEVFSPFIILPHPGPHFPCHPFFKFSFSNPKTTTCQQLYGSLWVPRRYNFAPSLVQVLAQKPTDRRIGGQVFFRRWMLYCYEKYGNVLIKIHWFNVSSRIREDCLVWWLAYQLPLLILPHNTAVNTTIQHCS